MELQISFAIYILCAMLYALGAFTAFNMFLTNRSNRKILIIAYVIYYVVDCAIYYLNQQTIVFTTISLLLLFLISFAHSKNILRNLIVTVIFIAFSFATELLSVGFCALLRMLIADLSKSDTTILSLILAKIIPFFTVIIVYSRWKKKDAGAPVKFNISTMLVPILSVAILYVMMIITNSIAPSSNNSLLFIIPVALLIVINILVFYSNYKNNKISELKQQNNVLKMTVDAAQHQYKLEDKLRSEFHIEKHNYKNFLIGIQSQLYQKKCEDAIALIDEHIGLLNNTTLANTGILSIDTVINYKAEDAKSKGITFEFTAKIDCDVNIPADDMCILLGVGLDNAIEYLVAHSNLKPCIRMVLKTEKNVLLIDIANPVADKILIIDNHIESTKDSHSHGLGLASAQWILDKYDGQLMLSCSDDTFHFGATLILPTK